LQSRSALLEEGRKEEEDEEQEEVQREMTGKRLHTEDQLSRT